MNGPFGAGGSYRDLYLVRPDGSHLRRLPSLSGHDGTAVWSPDGSRLAFDSDRRGAFDLYTMTPDGRDQRQLTHHEGSGGYAAYPSWSPDGSKIVFNASNPAPLVVSPGTVRRRGGFAARLGTTMHALLRPDEAQPLVVQANEAGFHSA